LKCRVCHRNVEKKGYCGFHGETYKDIIQKYGFWQSASGISWKEYLRKIADSPLTGEWAREVAKHLIRVEET